MTEFLGIAFRISITYLFLMTILRLSGKRSIDTATPMDFLISTALGDMFDDIFWAEISTAQGFVALGTFISLHTLSSFLAYRIDVVHHVITGVKTLLIKNGRFVQSGMDQERMRKEEIYSELRTQEEDKAQEIQEGSLEPSGEVSVIKREQYQKAQKADLPRLKELFK